MIRTALFDIDGTLVGGVTRHEEAFRHAFWKVFGVDASIRNIDYVGKSDARIIYETLVTYRIGYDLIMRNIDACMREMVEFYKAGEDTHYPLEGVKELLENLGNDGLRCGLITGNVGSIGWHKLRTVGLARYFTFGGFGSDAFDRAGVLRKALEKGDVDRNDVCVFGDTPRDIAAARQVGCRIVCVATGEYPVSKLQEADRVFSSFSDVEAVLRYIREASD